MALIAIITVWETVGALQKRASIFESWEGRNRPRPEVSGPGIDRI